MFNKYYKKLVLKYFGGKNILFFFFFFFFFFYDISGKLFEIDWNVSSFWFLIWLFSSPFFSGNETKSTEIDTGISQAVRQSSKISMAKNILEGRVETTLTTEKASLRGTQLMSGKTTIASINKHAISLLRRPTCLKWAFCILIRHTSPIRKIKKFTILTVSS